MIYNGATVNGFTYLNNVLTYTTPLVAGNNNFVVNATNTSGTVTASTNVTYSAPVVSTPAPIVA
ncbi:MAG: hypothetical protein IPH89_14040 [Bacteroidetes bacterium]|nr:hypothetical protein [Bacteroidota bacterium]